MGNEIIKPMSIERAEFISALADLIKTTKLPPFVIEPILNDVQNDLRILTQKQLENDMRRYNEMLEKHAQETLEEEK